MHTISASLSELAFQVSALACCIRNQQTSLPPILPFHDHVSSIQAFQMERQNRVNMFWRRLGSTLSLTDTRNVPEDESRSGSVCTLTTKLAEESSLISASQDTTFLSTEDDEDDDHLETSQKETSRGACSSILDLQPPATSTVTAKGPPSAFIGRCPRQHTIRYSTIWYRLDYVPDFFVCSRCYQDQIQSSRFEDFFLRFQSETGVPHRCRFWVPRMSASIWPDAMDRGVLGDLIGYAKLRVMTPDVVGLITGQLRSRIQWYRSPMGGFLCCPACYQDQIVGTNFEYQFLPYHKQELTGEFWRCSLCHPAVQKALPSYARDNDWRRCQQVIRRRNQGQPCKGRLSDLNTGRWYSTLPTAGRIWICEHCYLDRIHFTPFRSHFERIPKSVRQIIATDDAAQCALSTGPILMALEASLVQNNYDVFRHAVETISNSESCDSKGIDGGIWYGLIEGGPDFMICRACHAGIMTTCGLDGYCHPIKRAFRSKLVCSLNPSTPRFLHYIAKMGEALDTGNFDIFVKLTRKLSGLPPCPGREPIPSSSAWLSHGNCVVCPECYETTVSGTTWSKLFILGSPADTTLKICSLASPRMRAHWWEACRSRSLEAFAACVNTRLQVYVETIPVINDIKSRKLSLVDIATSLGALGVAVESHVRTSVRDAEPSTPDVGWIGMEHIIEGQRIADLMFLEMAEANREDEWRLIDDLEARWEEVE